MNNTIWRIGAALACLFLAVALLAVPPASAQDDDDVPETVDCNAIGLVQIDEYNCQPPVIVDDPDPTPTPTPTVTPVVLGEMVTPPPRQIAYGGSNVDGPVALGIALIGSGGLLVLAARNRRNRHDDETHLDES